ncbi:MAG: type II restriction endonuclease [Candidatus Aenigmatarchaeota archaeon]
MSEEYPNLQQEVQTPDGFLNEFKTEHMPGTVEMSDKAIERYEEQNGELTADFVRKNFNTLLHRMIEIETELYQEYEKQAVNHSPVLFLDEHYQEDNEYPETQQLLSDIERIFEEEDDFEDFFKRMFPKIYPLANYISQSASQSRRNRAGKSLESHIENLLEKMGYDFDRQEEVEGATIDIIIPSMDAFHNNPDYTIFLACQTTLKDRFRLSLSKLPTVNRVRAFIATATGKNLITSSDEEDLTEKKVQEIEDKGYRIIVFDEVKERFPDNNTVVSYSDFAQKELPTVEQGWN